MLTPIHLLKRIPLFSSLSEAERESLAAHLRRRALFRGEYLFRQGDEGIALHIILSGRVKISEAAARPSVEALTKGRAALARKGELDIEGVKIRPGDIVLNGYSADLARRAIDQEVAVFRRRLRQGSQDGRRVRLWRHGPHSSAA